MLLATWISSSTFSCSAPVILNFWIHLIMPYITLVSQLFSSTYWALAFFHSYVFSVFLTWTIHSPPSSRISKDTRFPVHDSSHTLLQVILRCVINPLYEHLIMPCQSNVHQLKCELPEVSCQVEERAGGGALRQRRGGVSRQGSQQKEAAYTGDRPLCAAF